MVFLTPILAWLGNLLGGPFAQAAVKAYTAKLAAENTTEKIAGELADRSLSLDQREAELNAATVNAEQGRWWTALPRPLIAYAFAVVVWKFAVWDDCFGLGAHTPLDPEMQQTLRIVLTAYFGGRSLEKTASIASKVITTLLRK